MSKKKQAQLDIALQNYLQAVNFLEKHPMFAPLCARVHFIRKEHNLCPENGWAIVTKAGTVHVHPTRRAEVSEWVYVLAHNLLHLGFGHFVDKEQSAVWNIACDCFIAKFLQDMKLGSPPVELSYGIAFSGKSEEELYLHFLAQGIPEQMKLFGTGGEKQPDLIFSEKNVRYSYNRDVKWEELFGKGLAQAVQSAVSVAGGYSAMLGGDENKLSPAQKAKQWFINHYPLLASLAANFTIIENQQICQRLNISVAAIDVTTQEIFFNPAAGLDEEESKFVMAHELLHAGLRHHERCLGRDPYFWNVSCDYVINHWLVEMGVGRLPEIGVLLDQELSGLSAEAIYDRIVTDLRTYRKLYTFRGIGQGDILDHGDKRFWDIKEGTALDDFYKGALAQGLVYHQDLGRGLLPAGLIEEIRALGQPPIPWDVELARWFDDHFPPLEKRRTFSRMSRRQSSTPDIPRPAWEYQETDLEGRTFGVVLDTSGSMDQKLLGKALGAIASYSLSKDVPFVRVVFCDAASYDAGYLATDEIAERVKIKGRGGTVLQPGIDLLEKAEDFPKNGPILIITDGYCDRIRVSRKHAFILPKGKNLPFVPRGPVFRID
ncbi:vWA domain-containing protein [Brevibacillus reuszeri]|uniref:vWA domain-containing protein n=1 Tax=Brevibacillus reuszeri TaxID=54915 RepID=UPI000CCC17D8|nr:VWA-like domain-containing protein [Brevibacillus reuszeri]